MTDGILYIDWATSTDLSPTMLMYQGQIHAVRGNALDVVDYIVTFIDQRDVVNVVADRTGLGLGFNELLLSQLARRRLTVEFSAPEIQSVNLERRMRSL